MAATDVVLNNLYWAIGQTVSVVVAGLDCGDYLVSAAGSVTVPLNADPDGLFNGAYLAPFDVGPWDITTYGDLTAAVNIADGLGGVATLYVPVLIGYTFTSQGQLMRPATEAQVKSPTGPGLGKTRRVHMYAIEFLNAVGVSVGTTFSKLGAVMFAPFINGPPQNKATMFTGVHQAELQDDETFDGQLCWQISRPYPCTVLAASSFLETQER